ncbi:hypothetical protein HKD42_04040 [Altererythrobacter sp. RZ02]|uniref:DUF4365 domain-containing protein n=1 Tax=Pontixanthobacter rizhaonensis TaxID=2730337 RepID=A0A848QJH3_9SPHN|nr:hypothetical protein [Pontixanthobacter rizhaonensis]NMW31224.1 hypothetical protein [Pontixanthobacter rizhaonensis]
MKNRKLNSDQLGKKGESRFPELCIDADLTPNAATWDRKGWDFILDWPHPKNSKAFDNRPAPLSCLVQLKTVWTSSSSIKLRLSSVEHIAKKNEPAFIYVLRANDDLTFRDALIVHLDGDFLAMVLKKLRQARADGKKPNEVFITVSLKKWFIPLSADGASLRSWIETSVGPSTVECADLKQKQLSNLGYETGGKFLHTTFKGENAEHLIDAFLGLRPIEVTNISATEKRFDIELPDTDFTPDLGTMHISPSPRDTCNILVEDDGFEAPLLFRAKIFGVPDSLLPENHLKLLVRADLFDLVLYADFSGSGRPLVTLTFKTDTKKISKVKASASEWSSFYGFMAALGERTLKIEIQPKKMPQFLSGSISLHQEGFAQRWQYPARLSSIAETILRKTASPNFKLRNDDIAQACQPLEVLDAMIGDPASLSALTFTTEPMDGPSDGDVHEMLYIDRFKLGSWAIAYAVQIQVKATCKESEIVWTGSVPNFRHVGRIKQTNQAYSRYIEKVRNLTGVQSHFAARTIAMTRTGELPNP